MTGHWRRIFKERGSETCEELEDAHSKLASEWLAVLDRNKPQSQRDAAIKKKSAADVLSEIYLLFKFEVIPWTNEGVRVVARWYN